MLGLGNGDQLADLVGGAGQVHLGDGAVERPRVEAQTLAVGEDRSDDEGVCPRVAVDDVVAVATRPDRDVVAVVGDQDVVARVAAAVRSTDEDVRAGTAEQRRRPVVADQQVRRSRGRRAGRCRSCAAARRHRAAG
jgi:hypothetical protein